MKRILCAALALLLGLGLLHAAAAVEVDPYSPLITKQPKAFAVVFAGKELKLEIEAIPRTGDNGVLSFEWYDSDWQLIATGTNVKIVMPAVDGLLMGQSLTYFAVVTNTYEDANGQIQTSAVTSDPVEVKLMQPLGKLISDFFEYAQFDRGPVFGLIALTVTSPFTLPGLIFVMLPTYFVLLIASLVF